MNMLKRWKGLRLEIAKYCRDNQITENDFRFLNMYEWQNVYDKILENFIDERYARNYGLHWANINGGFKQDIDRIYAFQEGVENNLSYEWIERLDEIVKCEKVYLLLEEDRQKSKLWIAECNPAIIHLIINEALWSVDYYIVDKKYNWLITENHHDFVQFIGKGLSINKIKSICTR